MEHNDDFRVLKKPTKSENSYEQVRMTKNFKHQLSAENRRGIYSLYMVVRLTLQESQIILRNLGGVK